MHYFFWYLLLVILDGNTAKEPAGRKHRHIKILASTNHGDGNSSIDSDKQMDVSADDTAAADDDKNEDE